LATPTSINTVILQGTVVPGTNKTLTRFETPFVTSTGLIAFRGTSADGASGIYLSDSTSGVREILSQPPGMLVSIDSVSAGGLYSLLSSRRVQTLTQYLVPDSLHVYGPSGLARVASSGDTLATHTLDRPGNSAITNNGDLYFVGKAVRKEGSAYRAVFRHSEGTLAAIVPGATDLLVDATISQLFNFRAVVANEKHTIAFIANIRNGEQGLYGSDGIFLFRQ
jgi:hypothetical protein